MHMCAWMCTLVQVPEDAKGTGFPGAVITGGCEPPDADARNQTLALYVNSPRSHSEPSLLPLNCLLCSNEPAMFMDFNAQTEHP